MRAPALLSLALLLGGPPAAAAGPGAGAAVSEARPRRVSVGVIDGLGPAADDLTRALQGHVADLEATVTIEARRAGDDLGARARWARGALRAGADAVLWVEPAADGPAILYLLIGEPPRLYLRPLTLGDDPLETAEVLGVIVRGTIASLSWTEAPAGMEEIDAPADAAADAPADGPPAAAATSTPGAPAAGPEGPATARRRGWLGIGYSGQSLARALPWASGVGLQGGLEGPRGLITSAALGWALHGPFEPRLGDVDLAAPLRIHRLGLDLRVGLRVRVGARRRGFVDVTAGVRGEGWIWRPLAGSSASAGGGMRLSLGPGVGGGVDLGRRLAVGAWAGLDLWARQLDLVARTPAGPATLLRPPLAGASLLAAVLVRLGGP